MSNLIPRKLGKVLVVDENPIEAELMRRKLLKCTGNTVEVAEDMVIAILRLNRPNHGYNFVFWGKRPEYPDTARRLMQEELGFSAD